ncbi:MAG TPA: hypothetical protein VNI83_08515 [Vicinamibacterales bacterium]|nr:hypothetical protein [Vicinamibacterales bacterium]
MLRTCLIAVLLVVPGAAAAQPPTGTPPPATAQPARPDAEAARRELAAARQALANLTALPQAAQLQGDARTLVSQVIDRFNALLTAETGWRQRYDEVERTLDALLGPGASPDAPPSPPPVALDAAIRHKLIEFRTRLRAFAQAMGAPPAGMPPAGTVGGGLDPAIDAHLAALDQLVAGALAGTVAPGGTVGTSGTATSPAAQTVTVDRATLEEMRRRIEELRRLLAGR